MKTIQRERAPPSRDEHLHSQAILNLILFCQEKLCTLSYSSILCRMLSGCLFILSAWPIHTSIRVSDLSLLAFAHQALESQVQSPALLNAIFLSFLLNDKPKIRRQSLKKSGHNSVHRCNALLHGHHRFGIDRAARIARCALQAAQALAGCGYTLGEFHASLTALWHARRYAVIAGICGVFVLTIILALPWERNTRRKLFHLCGLLIFWHIPRKAVPLTQLVAYAGAWAAAEGVPRHWVEPFLSARDAGPVVLSHVLLAGGCSYTAECLLGRERGLALLSLGVMDSLASVAGTWRKASRKTWGGFLAGQLAVWAAEFLAYRTVSLRYHLLMGLAEYCIAANDNIVLPVIAVGIFTERHKETWLGQALQVLVGA